MICRLMLVIHQCHGLDSQRRGCGNLRVGVMTDCEIESAIARPLAQSRRSSDQVSGFGRQSATTVAADHVCHHSCFGREFDGLRKVASRDLDLMGPRDELRYQGAKKWHVRRVSEIDPNAHGVRTASGSDRIIMITEQKTYAGFNQKRVARSGRYRSRF